MPNLIKNSWTDSRAYCPNIYTVPDDFIFDEATEAATEAAADTDWWCWSKSWWSDNGDGEFLELVVSPGHCPAEPAIIVTQYGL